MTFQPSVCIDAVFEGQTPEAALASIAELGYPAFEFWMWWEKDLKQLIDLKGKYSLQVAACCTKFISLVDPAQRSEYLEGLKESIDAARSLGCKLLISQVGDALPGVDRRRQQACLVEGLCAAADLLTGSGVTLAIEPLNEQIDHPGYFLVRSDEAFQIIDKVDSPQVKVTFDIYHQQISEGHLIATILEHVDKIAHFHAAGVPGRHELNCGEIHYPAIIEAIGNSGFDGYLGLEYWPQRDPIHGLQQVLEWF